MEACAVSAKLESQTDADENGEAGIILIAQLLGAVSYLPWRGNNSAFDRRFTPSG
jgi:hypothetical protein